MQKRTSRRVSSRVGKRPEQVDGPAQRFWESDRGILGLYTRLTLATPRTAMRRRAGKDGESMTTTGAWSTGLLGIQNAAPSGPAGGALDCRRQAGECWDVCTRLPSSYQLRVIMACVRRWDRDGGGRMEMAARGLACHRVRIASPRRALAVLLPLLSVGNSTIE